jgi:prepilin-type N-terminal cleavage/methylation domain-containing protein
MTTQTTETKLHACNRRGFSLVELMVAVAVFMVIGGAAVALVSRHVPLFTVQQSQAALTMEMRNAAAQMQIDVVNAGVGYYQNINVPAWPVGVTINNTNQNNATSVAANCHDPATNTYGPGCFDTLNIIDTDAATPPAYATDSTGAGCIDTSATTPPPASNPATSIYLKLPGAPSAADYKALAGLYHANDQIILVNTTGLMTTAVLSVDAVQASGMVLLTTKSATKSNGTQFLDAMGNSANDPLNLTTHLDAADASQLGNFTTQFCPPSAAYAGDWVLRLQPITYQVDATNPANPKLTRTVGGGAPETIAEQIIGFKIGAMLRNGLSHGAYVYDSTTYQQDWTAVTTVRVSMIGRSANTSDNFRNSFDGGSYRIESLSVVINPRNLNDLI